MSFDTLLRGIASNPTSSDPQFLRDLVNAIRPKKATDFGLVTDRLRALSFLLTSQPSYAQALRSYLNSVVASRKMVHLCTDTGITLSDGFWSAFWQRSLYKILPPLTNDAYFKDVFGTIFNHQNDHVWIDDVDENVWLELINAIGFNVKRARVKSGGLLDEMLSALQVLSYRISAIGLESELVRNYPAIERYESPFLRQNDEINDYIKEYRLWLVDHATPHRDSQQIDVLLTQCEEVVVKIRRHAAQLGVSISLTRLLLRVTQSIARLRITLQLIEAPNKNDALLTTLRLFKELVRADNGKYSIAELIKSNTNLLTIQVTEHAGRSGEHYVANTRAEWLSMLRSASGAGFIVGFMGLIKILFGKLLLAPFGFAFLYSLNYSLGFMLVHILHFTIATKQPAMTAALIAKSLDQSKTNLTHLSELIVQVCRTQFIAIIGNVAIAMPTAYAIAWAFFSANGHHIVTPEKAHILLQDINPFASLSLFHAAIAGVCLFLSGLISGYYDNKASYSHIPQRLRQLGAFNWIFGEQRWTRITTYIGDNLGALAGNFFFGIMLGSIGQIGVFLGLPIDIRHITFSSANFAFALAGLDNVMDWHLWAVSLLGIVLIGLVNLGVSFSLALIVAMRSRNVSFEQSGALVRLLFKRLFSHGRDFFFPPKEQANKSANEH